MSEKAWSDGYWQSADGLTLHYRDYAGREDRPPILCIPGLTRNARDFEPIADAFAGEWRVICAELRGRGESDYAKDTATYLPIIYAEDIAALIAELGVQQVVAVGTSLGGIVTSLMAAQDASRFAGVVLNDIGPVIEAEGLERIKEYVGQGRSFPTWMHAARALREQNGSTYPDFTISEWLRLAKRVMAVGNSGRIAWDYDMRIAEPFEASDGQPEFDMWPAFRALGGRPSLVLRGELSDILAHETLAQMEREIDGLQSLTVARTGHVPTLDEPEVQAAIASLLSRVA